MTLPYKKRKIDQALARQRQSGSEASITIEIGDGAAIPRTDDPGLYSAWKFVMIATPALLLFLTTYDYLASALLLVWPEAGWGREVIEKWAIAENNTFRRFFVFMPDGFLVTFQVTVYGICVALALGVLTGLGRISKIKALNLTASIYVEVVRGIPLFVQLFYIYYAVARFVPVPPMTAAISALGFCYGAYMGEVVRGGIEAIDRGQREAAMSLGFTPFQTMYHVILPQAMRTILPPIGNEFIALLKDSSLISVVAVPDIMRRGREFASTDYSYFEVFTVVALIYLFVTLLLSKAVSLLEIKLSRYERR
ncbi:MAG: amino acid ABC transporter permease [Candidatus Adiutrix sp.]|jgi:polar amino acid transport system permease protein|nr:amino acid ABC transporter permease [Candidatus Adiutrix sp.]